MKKLAQPAWTRPEGMQSLRDNFSGRFPAAAALQESDVVDLSFIDRLDESGFIRRMYGSIPP